ncbi:MAG: hypothetical protein ACLUOI_18460 [Eisenbergiella sp.]
MPSNRPRPVSARRAGTTAALDQLNKYALRADADGIFPVLEYGAWTNPRQVQEDEEGMRIVQVLERTGVDGT